MHNRRRNLPMNLACAYEQIVAMVRAFRSPHRLCGHVKVILSLLCPLYILRLEFKSKEELQLMPQTEEEHLENESIEDDRSTKDPTDAEVICDPLPTIFA